jgi:hypothetical protein
MNRNKGCVFGYPGRPQPRRRRLDTLIDGGTRKDALEMRKRRWLAHEGAGGGASGGGTSIGMERGMERGGVNQWKKEGWRYSLISSTILGRGRPGH